MSDTQPMPVDAIVAEIGSTTTVVSAFDGLSEWPPAPGSPGPRLLGQGSAPTTVEQGDVVVGLAQARHGLHAALGGVELAPRVTLATSSAAGGLRMTVHGLTQRMTAMAAREAALGAGGVVEYVTAGKMRDHDLAEVEKARPNLVLLAGGVEGGDADTVLFNARRLAELSIRPAVIYGGNSVVCDEATAVLEGAGFRVRVTSNVYPEVDELDILPARAAIHDAFEEHITHAPGMERIGEEVEGRILPTPGAVLLATEALAAEVGDVVVVDVGGATTDVHSVTDGSPELAKLLLDPQPRSKRTVEGDLGTYVSARHVAEMMPEAERPAELPPAMPTTEAEIEAAAALARFAAIAGVHRHAGKLVHVYTPAGRKTAVRGRDLTAVRLMIGTGGALTRLPGGIETLELARGTGIGETLLPSREAMCAVDSEYVFACCGALLSHFPTEAVHALMRRSAGL